MESRSPFTRHIIHQQYGSKKDHKPSVGGKLSRLLQHINYLDPPFWGPDTDIAAAGDKGEAEVWNPDQDNKVLGKAPMVETRLTLH